MRSTVIEKLWPAALGLLTALQFLPEFISSYGVLVVVLLWLWTGFSKGWQAPTAPWLYLLLLFWGWQLIGLVYSRDPNAGMEVLAMQLLLVLIPWQLFTLKRFEEKWLRLAFYVLWTAALLAAFYLIGLGLYRTFTHPGGHYAVNASYFLYYTGLSEPLMHPAYLSLLVVMAVVGAFWLRWRGHFSHGGYWVGQAILLLFLLMVSARMSLLAFVLSMLWLGWYLGWRQGKKRVLLISVLSLGVFAAAVFFVLPKRLQQRFTELSQLSYNIQAESIDDFSGLTIRLAEWEGVWVALQRDWLIGHGTGAGRSALQLAYESIDFKVGLIYSYNAHNQFLETALSNGVLGLLMLLILFAAAFVHARKQENWLAMWFLIFFFLCIQTESMLIRHRGALFFALYLALTMVAGRFSARTVKEQEQE
ncbi:MAG: O-antigen ligase family protein [Sphingobacteriaceae bacterium]|nr:O-antigen ligase family protein [Sphingobacteriaceae bacterium]